MKFTDFVGIDESNTSGDPLEVITAVHSKDESSTLLLEGLARYKNPDLEYAIKALNLGYDLRFAILSKTQINIAREMKRIEHLESFVASSLVSSFPEEVQISTTRIIIDGKPNDYEFREFLIKGYISTFCHVNPSHVNLDFIPHADTKLTLVNLADNISKLLMRKYRDREIVPTIVENKRVFIGYDWQYS